MWHDKINQPTQSKEQPTEPKQKEQPEPTNQPAYKAEDQEYLNQVQNEPYEEEDERVYPLKDEMQESLRLKEKYPENKDYTLKELSNIQKEATNIKGDSKTLLRTKQRFLDFTKQKQKQKIEERKLQTLLRRRG